MSFPGVFLAMKRSHICLSLLCAALTLSIVTPSAVHAQAPGAKRPISFIKDVAPILKENCFACHDSKKRKGKLDMTTYESLRKGGDKDDPIVPGQPDDSLLLDLVTGKGGVRMPPKDSGEALPPAKIAILEQWIKEGAKLDEGLSPKADLVRELRARWQPPAPPRSYHFPEKVTAVVFTPDNQKLVVGGHHELLVYDVNAAKLEKRIRTRAERTYALAFLPDGSLVAAGGRPGQEGDVRVYQIDAGQPKVEDGVAFLDGVNDKAVMIKQLLDADDSVLCLAVSGDGKKLASGGCDRMIHVWDIAAGVGQAKEEQAIENHADWVMGVAFSPDGTHLLSASRDKTAKVWDLKAKESLLTFNDHQNGVYGVAIKPDGKFGFSVGEDGQLRRWNATGEGKQVPPTGGHSKPAFRVLYHPKQPLLATCCADHAVRLWNPDTMAAVKTLAGHTDWVYALAFSPDGNLLASGSWNGEVKVWKVADGAVVKAFNGSPGVVTASAPKK
jgi:WD40 repeat protein